MKTIHLQGFLDNFDIKEQLENRVSDYQYGIYFPFEEETEQKIGNVFMRMYFLKEQGSLEEAIEKHLRYIFGDLELTGKGVGYSEFTIEGYQLSDAKLGGHDLNKIIKSMGKDYKYVHVLMDQVKTKIKKG